MYVLRSPLQHWGMDEHEGTARKAGRAVGRVVGKAELGARAAIRKNPTADRVYRTTVGVTGTGTEFESARKTSTAANRAARKAVAHVQQNRAAKKAARDAAAGASSTPHSSSS